jgi:hypothetical protein
LRGVETPLALLQVEVKVGGGDAVETTHMTLGLIPEVLDAVDVVLLIDHDKRLLRIARPSYPYFIEK